MPGRTCTKGVYSVIVNFGWMRREIPRVSESSDPKVQGRKQSSLSGINEQGYARPCLDLDARAKIDLLNSQILIYLHTTQLELIFLSLKKYLQETSSRNQEASLKSESIMKNKAPAHRISPIVITMLSDKPKKEKHKKISKSAERPADAKRRT